MVNNGSPGPRRCVIIGSGCAGLTAGIYAARSNMDPLILGGLVPGGQLMITSDVENYPGFEEPTAGPELMESMRRQCLRLGVHFINEQVSQVELRKGGPFKIWTTEGRLMETAAVIVATGASAKWLGLESERKFMGKGISACATCDGFFFKGKSLVVVGGGDTAMEEATFLTNFATSVTVVHRRDKLRASAAMQEKAKRNPKIQFLWNYVVDEVIGGDSVEGVRLRHVENGQKQSLECKGVFVAIGHEPATQFLRGQVDLDNKGYIKVRPDSFVLTSVEGVFAAGDCADHRYRQAVTAAGFGCMAAMEALWYLEGKGLTG